MSEKLAIIGTGMMGSAILSGILNNQSFKSEDICIFDADRQKMLEIQEKTGVKTAGSGAEAVKDAGYVLIAVKPQYLDEVLDNLRGIVHQEALVLSIVVGVPVTKFQKKLNHQHVLRIMPNTPAAIGEGVSGWYATESVSNEQRSVALRILNATGKAVEVKRESDLDFVTALSGSGPAYVYLFIEALIDTAVQLGLPRPAATELAIQTVKGSALYLQQRSVHPAILKNEVTSPGGTTAAALFTMEKEGLRTAVAKGMIACYEKTLELGANLKPDK